MKRKCPRISFKVTLTNPLFQLFVLALIFYLQGFCFSKRSKGFENFPYPTPLIHLCVKSTTPIIVPPQSLVRVLGLANVIKFNFFPIFYKLVVDDVNPVVSLEFLSLFVLSLVNPSSPLSFGHGFFLKKNYESTRPKG